VGWLMILMLPNFLWVCVGWLMILTLPNFLWVCVGWSMILTLPHAHVRAPSLPPFVPRRFILRPPPPHHLLWTDLQPKVWYRLNKIEKMEGGSPKSYAKVRMDEYKNKGEFPIKTKRMKSNDSMEMLKFFDLLPEGAQEEILKNLCRNATEFTKDEDKEEELPPTACLCLKAVARALGENDLPTNLLHKVLEGFSKSSTKLFNKFCTSQIALRRGSFYQTLIISSKPTQQCSERSRDFLSQLSWRKIVGRH
jgi:hypothetical protein